MEGEKTKRGMSPARVAGRGCWAGQGVKMEENRREPGGEPQHMQVREKEVMEEGSG